MQQDRALIRLNSPTSAEVDWTMFAGVFVIILGAFGLYLTSIIGKMDLRIHALETKVEYLFSESESAE